MLAMATGLPLTAQTPPDGLTFTTVDPPTGESTAAYDKAAGVRVRRDATYATEVHGGSLTPESRAPAARREGPVITGPALSGNAAMLVVLALLAVALFLWLRFGGGGILARAPRADRPRDAAPAGWDMAGDDDQLTGEALLRSIAAMADRRAAMVRLLRHCLLQAAHVTGTRLARSDTERRVLERLPADFSQRHDLPRLLGRTELAHYGGRAVADTDFTASLTAARSLLTSGGAHA